MSIANEITRLNNAKSAIASAITEKGVTVPTGTKLDGMASLIGKIQQGASLETTMLAAGSAVGGYTFYIDENGQGQRYTGRNQVTCLKGSYFILDYADTADAFYYDGCEIVQLYGPLQTTTGSEGFHVIIFKITGDDPYVML